MRIVELALKDLSQILRDRKSAAFLVLMPVAFTLFFGFAFASVGTEADTRPTVGWVNQDGDGTLGESLHKMLASSEAVRLVELNLQQAANVDDVVRKGQVAAAVIVPAGFSDQTLAGQTPALTVVALTDMSNSQAAGTAVQSVVKRLLSAVEAARLSADAAAAQKPFPDAGARKAYIADGAARALAAWEQPPLSVTAAPTTPPQAKGKAPSGFAQSSPGMLVQFTVFSLITSAMVLVMERKSGALQRLLTTPIRPAEIIAGHMLAMFLVVLLQDALLIGLGQLAFHVDYLREAAGILVLVVALALWAASLGLLISTICRAEEQVIMWSLIAMFVFAMLGGAWFPLEIAGKGFAAFGHIMPTAWAMDGLQNIVVRGLGVSSTLLPAGILVAYALACFGLAIWRFKFE